MNILCHQYLYPSPLNLWCFLSIQKETPEVFLIEGDFFVKENFSVAKDKALLYNSSIERCADVAQLVEHQLPKLRVAGSNPVVRSKTISGIVRFNTETRL